MDFTKMSFSDLKNMYDFISDFNHFKNDEKWNKLQILIEQEMIHRIKKFNLK